MPKINCYNRQQKAVAEECKKCKQGKQIEKEIRKVKVEIAVESVMNKKKGKQEVSYSIKIDRANSVIDEYPDLEELLQQSAIGNVRTVENQALWYILQGVRKDGFGAEEKNAGG